VRSTPHTLVDGGRYDPATDAWRSMTTDGAPSRRNYPAYVWTGSELVVWGGNGGPDLNDGGRYTP
jgi:hypothetical protein